MPRVSRVPLFWEGRLFAFAISEAAKTVKVSPSASLPAEVSEYYSFHRTFRKEIVVKILQKLEIMTREETRIIDRLMQLYETSEECKKYIRRIIEILNNDWISWDLSSGIRVDASAIENPRDIKVMGTNAKVANSAGEISLFVSRLFSPDYSRRDESAATMLPRAINQSQGKSSRDECFVSFARLFASTQRKSFSRAAIFRFSARRHMRLQSSMSLQ